MPLLDSPRSTTSDEFRAFFRRHAAGVAIVTTATRTGPVGFTASSVASVSVTPPLVSFNVSRTSASWTALLEATHVGVHRLSVAEVDLAALFGRRGAARFDEAAWSSGEHGVPVLHRPRSWLIGAITQRVEAGDSAIVVAEVFRVHDAGETTARSGSDEAPPLVYAAGGYADARSVPVPLPAPARRRPIPGGTPLGVRPVAEHGRTLGDGPVGDRER